LIIHGTILKRIGADVFVIKADGQEYKLALHYKSYPEEHIRLRGHVCDEVAGLITGVACDLDVENGVVSDIRFAVPDQISDKEELSTVISILDGGTHAFLERACKCPLHISVFEISKRTHVFFQDFDLTQVWAHKVHIFKNRVEAFDAKFVGMVEGETFHAGRCKEI